MTRSLIVHGCAQGGLFLQLVKSEGPRSLYLGLTPAFMRSVLYGGLRLGLYEPSKYVCGMAFESSNVLVKIASGAFSGAIATALTNPVEVLKVFPFSIFPQQCRPCLTSYFYYFRYVCKWIQIQEED